ncbi:protamine-like [Diachasmimorpha longicaudata]|uniref:protamine-like n=1 Tax=Diachasmimorpha longicaudata TaxID=58733 RepID=UPI0030B88A53
MAPRKTAQFEKIVVRAIKTLQDIQGSTSKEISNYLAREYDVSSEEIKKQVHLALRRGIDYGLLKRQQGGTYVCNKELFAQTAKRDEDARECSTAYKKLRAWRKSRGKRGPRGGRKSRRRGRRGRGRRRKRSGSGKKRRGGRRRGRRRSRRRSRGRK